MKITDVTVKRYSASRDARADAAGIQIVEVHTDAGVTGMGFVSAGGASSDIVATLVRRNLKAVLVGEDPLLTDDLWRRMHDRRFRAAAARGSCATCMAAVDFALWDLKGKLLNAPVSALLGGRRPPRRDLRELRASSAARQARREGGRIREAGAHRAQDPRLRDLRVARARRPSA